MLYIVDTPIPHVTLSDVWGKDMNKGDLKISHMMIGKIKGRVAIPWRNLPLSINASGRKQRKE